VSADHVTYRATVSADVHVAKRFVDALGDRAFTVARDLLRDVLSKKVQDAEIETRVEPGRGQRVIVRDACGIEAEWLVGDPRQRLILPVRVPFQVTVDEPPMTVSNPVREFEFRGRVKDGMRVLEEVVP